jgi:hypothetical protein
MSKQTVFEQSEIFRSPSGKYEATVCSQSSGPGQELTQAIVAESGLIAFYAPRVSMAFEWNGDEELLVRYPDDVPAPRIDATNSSFGPGGRCRVIYRAVPRSQVPPLQWTRAGELRVVAEESLERGALVTLETDGRVEYSFSYYDVDEPDSSAEALQARGLQGGGETWAGIIYGLVALRAPHLSDQLELDPESDGLAVRSSERAALLEVARLVATAKRDEAVLEAAISRALEDDQIE